VDLIVPLTLFFASMAARAAGALGVKPLNSWPAAVRVGLAAMLLLTSSAHFTSMRHDLVKMVPPAVPAPMAMIYFTGVCEIAGAIGLLVPRLRVAAAWCLLAMFVALLPANIHAARAGVQFQGEPATPLIVRIPEQLIYLVLTWWSGIYAARSPR
jgi:uncharacterized membrane protein